MRVDAELDIWRRQWQRQTEVSKDLRMRVERQSRFMIMMLLAEVLVTVLVGGGATGWAIRSQRAEVMVLAGFVWLFVAAAWAFALISRRNCWSPATGTTAAFIDLSIRRCRAGIAATSFGTGLFFFEVAFCLTWVYWYGSHESSSLPAFLISSRVLLVWFCTLVFLGFVAWYRRRKRAEIAFLLGLQQELRSHS